VAAAELVRRDPQVLALKLETAEMELQLMFLALRHISVAGVAAEVRTLLLVLWVVLAVAVLAAQPEVSTVQTVRQILVVAAVEHVTELQELVVPES
jgi:hypothetical protein